VLGAAAFWLTDITTSMFGFGSLGFLGEAVPYDPTEQYLSASLRGTPLQLVAVFAIAVWLSHRLRAAAGPALTQATGLYVAAVVVTNVAFASMGERMLSSAEIIVPLLNGVLVWLVTLVGRGYARRTQPRFDAMRMALAR
jgi:threonine/homoserine efflux transporter RhtA